MASILFLLALGDTSLASIAQTFFQAMAGHYTLLAIPFFILASSFMSTGGVARRIIRFSVALVGHVPGGLAIAGVFACMMFAALSGSSPATVVAIGSIVIAGMHQVGYTKDFCGWCDRERWNFGDFDSPLHRDGGLCGGCGSLCWPHVPRGSIARPVGWLHADDYHLHHGAGEKPAKGGLARLG
jgi:hypothetical protein